MKWASALSRQHAATGAFAEAAEGVSRQLGGAAPVLLLVFASPHHASAFETIGALARRRFPEALLAGCTAGGVIGDAREVEDGPGLSLTAAVLPDVRLHAFHLEMTSLPPPEAGAWRSVARASPQERPKFLLLADPWSLDAAALIAGLDLAYPGAVKFGGLASGGGAAGENRLLLGEAVHRTGAIGVVLTGNLAVDTVVAQGCRPVGKPMLATRCRDGMLEELDGQPPLQVLQDLYQSLPERDRELMRHSLFLGIDMREERIEFDSGELLVRNLLGADQRTGALAVGSPLRPMQVVQFVLRDARTAEEDLLRMLERRRRSAERPAGALLFSCVGRGSGLFGRPDHDTGLFEEKLGPAPLGGFFCNGEIGPVGGATFLHGYTSAFALFGEARPAEPAHPGRA